MLVDATHRGINVSACFGLLFVRLFGEFFVAADRIHRGNTVPGEVAASGSMARIIRLPDTLELPPSPRRDFVTEVFDLYQDAGRPTLRTISNVINRSGISGTASPETVRRMLNGTNVPASWTTVDAVLIALCDMAGHDPSDEVRYDGRNVTAATACRLSGTVH